MCSDEDKIVMIYHQTSDGDNICRSVIIIRSSVKLIIAKFKHKYFTTNISKKIKIKYRKNTDNY